MNRYFALIWMACGLAWLAMSCSTKKANAPGSKKSAKEEEGIDDCDAKAKKSSKADLRLSFNLLATTYADVESAVKSDCLSCHKKDGSAEPDLSTYSLLKEHADKSLERMESSDNDLVMPPTGKWSTSKIDKFKAWIDDGLKDAPEEKEEKEDEEKEEDKKEKKTSTSDSSSKTSSDPCDSSKKGGSSDGDLETESDDGDDDTGEEKEKEKEEEKFKIDPELYKQYFEPEELKACHAQGKTYLRAGSKVPDDPTPRCDTVNHPASFKCDDAGVKEAFKNSQAYLAKIDELKGLGMTYDQCGETDGKPVVYFVCFHSGDNVCIAPEKFNSDTLKVKTSKLGG